MVIKPSTTYKFVFNSEFSSHDGVYKVLGILSYDDAINQGADLFKSLYEPLGITESTFNSYLTNLRKDDVLKVESKTTSVISYLPTSILSMIPNSGVSSYPKLNIGIDVGVYSDSDTLSTLVNDIKDMVSATLGSDTKVVMYTRDSVWLTETEYNTLEASRQENITSVNNNYTDKVSMAKTITDLQTKIAYYEEFIVNQYGE